MSARNWLAGTLLLAVLYAATAKLSFAVAFGSPSIAPVWLPSGLAVAAVLRYGYRAVPGVWLGAFAFNACTPVPVWVALMISLGHAGEAATATWLLRKVGFRTAVDRVRDVLALTGLGAMIATAVSATCGVTGLLLGGLVTTEAAASAWLLWWSGDGIGVFSAVPVLLLVWATPRTAAWPGWRRLAEAGLMVVLLAVVVSIGLRGGPVRPFLVLPVLVWAAIRFPRAGANVASLFISAVVVYASSRGTGPFAAPSEVDTRLATQSFVAVIMISSRLLAATTIERDRIAADLRAERERLREAKHIARLGSWVWDIAGDSVRCSEELADIYGLAGAPPLTFRGFVGRVHPDDRTTVESGIAAAVRDRAPFAAEHRIVRPDGEVRTVHTRGVAIVDARGRTTRMSGTGLDVSELRAARDALRDQQAQTQAIVDTASDAFVSVDQHGLVTSWNRSAERLFGWRANEAIGQPLTATIVPPAARDAHVNGLRRVVAGGPGHLLGQRIEVSARCRDGREVPVELAVWRVRSRGGPLFHAFIRDISDRRRIERNLADARDQALAGSRLQSQFFTALSQEIRTPLNAILGLTELTLLGPLDGEERGRAEGIHDAGRTVLAMVDDIVDYSRLEAGQLAFDEVDFDLDAVLHGAAAAVERQAHAKAVALAASRDPAVPARLRGDPARLRKVLHHLAVNAVRRTDHGGVTIHAAPADPDTASGAIRIDVTDTGAGIPEHRLGAVFEPFLDAAAGRPSGATGLGLYISRRLVEAMGGRLTVASRAGSGSTFTCVVPYGAARETEPARHHADRADVRDGSRLLLVDDDEVGQAVLLDLLTGYGYEVDRASNGMQAVSLAGRRTYAAILMDCQMPLMDGYAASAMVRRREPPGERVPIIGLAPSAFEEDRKRCLAAGMDDLVGKPVDVDTLAPTVARWARTASLT